VKYLKLYENFELEMPEVDIQPMVDDELSNYTIDDVLSGALFDDDFEDEDEGSYVDAKGVIHIKNWEVY
jgi:hypothetical protein